MRFAVNIPNFGDFADPRLVADLARRVEEAGRAAGAFDLIVSGSSAPETAADVTGPLAEAGATWWQECAWDENLERVKPMLRRVEAGPPR
jgi:hypothetical protein